MFCEHCGSQIPDGSKFCTECGTPVPQAPEPQETVSAPRQPSPSAEPAWTPPPQQNAWQQPDQTTRPPENAWQQPAGNSFGYSTVGGGDGQSAPRPAAASGQVSWDPERASGGSKPVTKQWWFWLIIVLAAAAVLAAALFFLFKARKTEAPELTTGTGDTTFSPDNICTRGQIVTFLYRALAE